ncbi:MAG: flavodoxin-dependent (E)-4-hydroxy-3-methylbut-2-enyl-diphosphate synthase [Ruminococcaceae bacterium]|nr:flavodoxin-dependent (E)-4-hydroxy-3-methylbut-2-enyl-diphosphate synthase [Oscillospiraceae bacterium]
MERRQTRKIAVGELFMGGGERILIQSMTNAPAHDRENTLSQIKALERAGCDVVRFTVPDMETVRNIAYYKENSSVALVADIHFDHRLAVESVAAGIDKVRINPGNIGSADKVKKVALACLERKVPIRIGVNSGSVEKRLLEKYQGPTAEALAQSGIEQAQILEGFGFSDIVISVKSSSVATMIKANRLLAQKTDYPLHLGVTEAGGKEMGTVKSAVGIGSLLIDGIGDTVRVSLTDDVTQEVDAAKKILLACGLQEGGIDLVSCPTCGRTKIDLISIVKQMENKLAELKLSPKKTVKAAVMGCAVNGPGEAREADVGIAGGDGYALLFKKGQIIEKIPEDKIVEVLTSEIVKLCE